MIQLRWLLLLQLGFLFVMLIDIQAARVGVLVSFFATALKFGALIGHIGNRLRHLNGILPLVGTGIRKAVRHARMAHKATKWLIKKNTYLACDAP